MWLYMDRKLRRMGDGDEGFEKVLYDKIDPKVRVYGYLLNKREYCNTQEISWSFHLAEKTTLRDILEELESEGKIYRKPDDIIADRFGGLWKANF